LVRSVQIRPCPNREFYRFFQRFPDPNAIPEAQEDHAQRAYTQYERNAKYRRAFICERCYKLLDTYSGVGVVTADGQSQSYGLSGRCRRGKAAVYDYGKWMRYQRERGAQIGIDVAD
jgi:hypothetical protein